MMRKKKKIVIIFTPEGGPPKDKPKTNISKDNALKW